MKATLTPAHPLTERQTEVLQAYVDTCGGRSEVGAWLGISPKTVDIHLGNIFAALGTNCVLGAVIIAARLGLVEVPTS